MNPEKQHLHGLRSTLVLALMNFLGRNIRDSPGLPYIGPLTLDLRYARAFEDVSDLVPGVRVLASGRPRRELDKADYDLDPVHANDIRFKEIGGLHRHRLRIKQAGRGCTDDNAYVQNYSVNEIS